MPEPDAHERLPDPVPPTPLSGLSYEDLDRGERIGAGGDATVVRATVEHGGYSYPVAVKEPRFQGTIQRSVVERFEREAETWSGLDDHDNIVTVYDWGTEPLPWLALEYMDGGTLADRLGDLDLPEALWLAGRIVEGVRYGHRHGVAHLDLKPTNVLLRDTGTGTWDYPKVSDWGLAKLLLEASNSVEGVSPQYAAPEQFDAETFGPPDDITDIYQMGAVCYALLVGEPPFSGSATAVMQGVLHEDPQPPSERNPDVPAALDEVVLRALAKRKEDRYEGLLPFRKELDRLFEVHAGNADTGADGTATTGAPSPGGRDADRPDANRADGPASSSTPGRDDSDTGAPAGSVDTEPTSTDTWSTPYVDIARTAHAPTASGPTDDVAVQWRFDPDDERLRAPPVADEDRIYLVTRAGASAASHVYALGRASGTPHWTFDLDHHSESPPMLADGTLFVGDNANHVRAIDAATGTEAWCFEAPDRINRSGPTVVGDTVYVVSGFRPNETGRLHALDRADGDERWHVDLPDASECPPAVRDGLVYVGCGDSNLYAVSIEDRAIRWRFEPDGAPGTRGIDDPPVVVDGTVYVTAADTENNARLFALDAATGSVEWVSDPHVAGSSAVVDDTVYVSGTYTGDGLVALDAATGTKRWESESGPGLVALAADGVVYTGGLSGVYAVDAATGEVRWELEPGGSTAVPPVVLDGNLYVVNGETLFALGEA